MLIKSLCRAQCVWSIFRKPPTLIARFNYPIGLTAISIVLVPLVTVRNRSWITISHMLILYEQLNTFSIHAGVWPGYKSHMEMFTHTHKSHEYVFPLHIDDPKIIHLGILTRKELERARGEGQRHAAFCRIRKTSHYVRDQ